MSNVSIHDTCFTVNRGELPHMMHKQGNEHWKNFKDTLAFLGSIGFYVGEDKRIKKVRIYYHTGGWIKAS